MTDDHQELFELHDRQVNAVADAVAKLIVQLAPLGFTPETVFEGAVRGGSVALMAGREIGAPEIADLLDDMASAFRNLAKPNLRVVN